MARLGPVLWGRSVTTSPIACRMPPFRSIARKPNRSGPGFAQVRDDDAVIVDYELAAPLSSRRKIYGCELDVNLPRGWPRLGPEFRWLFVKNGNRFYNLLLEQGFEVVHHGKIRDRSAARRWQSRHEIPIFSDFARTRRLDKMSIDRTAGRRRGGRVVKYSNLTSLPAVESIV